MPTIERDSLLSTKDENGNIELHYPITRKDNVLGLDDIDFEKINADIANMQNFIGDIPTEKGGTCTPKACMLNGRSLHHVVSIDNKLYAIGGTPTVSPIEIYNISTDTWESGAIPPRKVTAPAIVNTRDRIYVIGGYDTSAVAYMEIYDVASNTWVVGANMVTGRRNHTATLFDGKIYVIGGNTEANAGYLQSIEIYDIASNTWSAGANMPTVRAKHTATLIDGKIYVIGGQESSSVALTSVIVYDIASNTWTNKSPMTIKRYSHASVCIGKKIFTIGGFAIKSMEIYDVATDEWVAGSDFPVSGTALKAVTIKDRIYVVYGSLFETADMFVYDTVENIWSTITLPIPGQSHATTYAGGKIYITGGAVFNGGVIDVNTLYSYTVPTPTILEMLDKNSNDILELRDDIIDPINELQNDMQELTNIASEVPNIRNDVLKVSSIVGEAPKEIGWHSNASMMTLRSRHTITPVGNKIYIIGGNISGNRVEIYDTMTGAISSFNLSVDRRDHVACLVDNNIYIIGGGTPDTMATMLIYNITTGTLTDGAEMPVAESCNEVMVIGNKIYVVIFGGIGNPPNILVYDTTTNTWSSRSVSTASVLKSKTVVASTVANDKIYIITAGGDPAIYDINSDTWALGPTSALGGLTSTIVIDNKIYIIGGTKGEVRIYDIDTNTWAAGSSLPTHPGVSYRSRPSLVRVGDTIHVIGGDTNVQLPVIIYDIASDTWSVREDLMIALSGDNKSCATLVNNRVYIVGNMGTTMPNRWALLNYRVDQPVRVETSRLSDMVADLYKTCAPSLITGTFVGNGNTSGGQIITLGFMPSAVTICQIDTYTLASTPMVGVILIPGTPSYCKTTSAGEALNVGEIISTGFKVYGNGQMTNASGKSYYYIAHK